MRSNFIAGLALGALAGMTLIESSSQLKSLFKKGKQAAMKIAEKAGQSSNS